MIRQVICAVLLSGLFAHGQTRRVRVIHGITGTSNANATTIKTNIDTCLGTKPLYKTTVANNRSGTRVTGNYSFTTDADGDSFFSCIGTETLSTRAATGSSVEKHLCDHDINEQGFVGVQCLLPTTTIK